MGPGWHQVDTKPALSWHQVETLLAFGESARYIKELSELMEWKDRTKFRAKYISPLQELELLAMTFRSKPKSSKQQYYLSEKESCF